MHTDTLGSPGSRRRGRLVRGAVAVVAVAGSLAADAGAATRADPPSAAELRTYLGSVRLPWLQVYRAEVAVVGEVNLWGFGDAGWKVKMVASCGSLSHARAALTLIPPPAALLSEHAGLTRAARSESKACNRFVAEATPGDGLALGALSETFSDARHAELDWRGEVTGKLRKRGLAVPRWVSRVGTAPLPG